MKYLWSKDTDICMLIQSEQIQRIIGEIII